MKIIKLPKNYAPAFEEDLRKKAESANIVNIGKALVAAVMGLVGILFVSPFTIFTNQDITLKTVTLKILLFFLMLMIYLLLTETFRYALMTKFGGTKAYYNYKFLYVYTGSKAYFGWRSYTLLSVLPPVVIGLLLLVLIWVLPLRIFWFLYVLLIIDLAGLVSDIYICSLLKKFKGDVLIRDTGDTLKAYYQKKNLND